MKIGDLIRYKHNKYRMGVALGAPIFVGGDVGVVVLVQFMQSAGGKSRWRVPLTHIEVKGDGRYGWRDAA